MKNYEKFRSVAGDKRATVFVLHTRKLSRWGRSTENARRPLRLAANRFRVANPKCCNPAGKPGITNDALYTNATIAINPDTGKLLWHYQHLSNDQWDLDWAFERQIVRLQARKLVITAGKPGIYDALEAATGEYAGT